MKTKKKSASDGFIVPTVCEFYPDLKSVNLFQPSVAFHIEISHLFCRANDWFLYET